MAFRFALATLLRLRESMEKREELKLEAIQSEIGRLRRLIDALDAEIAADHQALQKSLQNPTEARVVQLTLNQIQEKVQQGRDLLLRVEQLLLKQKEQLKVYRAAARARQVLSDMHAQKRTEYDEGQIRAQQKFLDDIFASRSQRR